MSKCRAVQLSNEAFDYKVYSGIEIEPIWLVGGGGGVVVGITSFPFNWIFAQLLCYA